MGVAYKNECISRRLNEELAWVIDKQLWIISDKMLLKIVVATTKKLKNKAILSLRQYCVHCYVTFSNEF